MVILFDPDPNGQQGGQQASDSQNQGGDSGGGAATETPSWIDVLPEEAAKDPDVTRFKTPEEFYKGYKHNRDLASRKGVIVPKPDSSPEEREKFYNDLGRPEKPEGYKLEQVQNLHPSIRTTPELTQAYSAMAHKHGLTNEQANGMNKYLMDVVSQATVAQEKRETEAVAAAETAMRQEWGQNFDANKQMVVRGLMKAGGQEVLDAMGGEKGLGNNPAVLRTLAKVFSAMGEDKIGNLGGGNSGGQGNESKEQALAKISAMTNDPKHPINDEKSPEHKEAVKERLRLYEIAYPNEAQ